MYLPVYCWNNGQRCQQYNKYSKTSLDTAWHKAQQRYPACIVVSCRTNHILDLGNRSNSGETWCNRNRYSLDPEIERSVLFSKDKRKSI